MISQAYFRIDTEMVEHVREVYRLMDFIGDLGGVPGVIEYAIIFIFGGYLSFNTSFTTMLSLYSKEEISKHHHHHDEEGQHGKAEEEHGHGHAHEGGNLDESVSGAFIPGDPALGWGKLTKQVLQAEEEEEDSH